MTHISPVGTRVLTAILFLMWYLSYLPWTSFKGKGTRPWAQACIAVPGLYGYIGDIIVKNWRSLFLVSSCSAPKSFTLQEHLSISEYQIPADTNFIHCVCFFLLREYLLWTKRDNLLPADVGSCVGVPGIPAELLLLGTTAQTRKITRL